MTAYFEMLASKVSRDMVALSLRVNAVVDLFVFVRCGFVEIVAKLYVTIVYGVLRGASLAI